MEEVVDLVDESLTKGAHAILFCSLSQFPKWCAQFSTVSEDVDVLDPDNPAVCNTVSKKVFSVERTPLQFIRGRGNYKANPATKRLTHMSMGELAVHVWRNGLEHNDMLQRVDYNLGGYVSSTLPGWTNTMDNIPRLPATEVVYGDVIGNNGRPVMLRPEQKNISVMKTLVAQYSPPGGIVLDPFNGTFAVAKACLSLPSHRRCVCGDADPRCIQHGLLQLVEVFARQLLNEDSDITATPAVNSAATTFLNSVEAIRARKFVNTWETPPGLHPIQLFPPHILQCLSTFYGDYSLSHHLKFIPYNLWSPLWRSRFDEIDTRTLLTAELMSSNLELRQSTIPNAGRGLFTTKMIGVNQVIGHYYGTLVYDNLARALTSSAAVYGEGKLALDSKGFTKWCLQTKWKARSRPNEGNTTSGYAVWIYPAPFCAMRFMNDAMITPKERASMKTGTAANPAPNRDNNVSFKEMKRPTSAIDFRHYNVISVIADRNIAANEELFVDYSDSYTDF